MSTIFQTVCGMSLVGTFVILLALAVRLCLCKCPKWLSYALWSIVFLRLICPVFPSSPFSLVPEPVAHSRSTDRQREQQTEAAPLPQSSGTAEVPEENMYSFYPEVPAVSDLPGQLLPSKRILAEDGGLAWLEGLTAVWALGLALLLCCHGISYRRLKRRLLGAVEKEQGVYETDGEHLSFVLGFFRPRIYLSADLEPEERRLVLCHERVHLRRRDYLVKPACLVIACIHWFNPFVWLAFHLMNRDMEISCDEQVVRRLGEESKESYSRALLQAAMGTGVKRKKQSGACTFLSFGEDNVKKRISRVLRYRKAPVWVLAAGVALVLLLAAGLLSNPSKGMSEGEALRLVREAGGYGEESEAVCFLGDFDENGGKEAFVEIGSPLEEEWLEGDFWFVSEEKEAVRLKENIFMEREAAWFEAEEERMLLLNYVDGNPLLTAVYGVRDGEAVEHFFDSSEEKYGEDHTLNCMVSAYDVSYDRETELFAGHSKKPYPYYYENGEFRLYPAEEISREQVKTYENGLEILEAIETAHPGSRYQYLLRDNGLLYINRAEDDGDYISFAYTACRIAGNRLGLLQEGEGCYRKDFSDEQEDHFVRTVAADPVVPGQEWLGLPKEYRAFAEKIRRCIEHEDAAGMYELLADSVNTSSGQLELGNEEAFEEIYGELFTPEVKHAVLTADLNQLFSNWQGVCIGSGVIWFQPYTQSDGSIIYRIYAVNQPGTGIRYGKPDLKREWRNLCQQQGATAARADEWFERMQKDGVLLEDSYQFTAFFMGDWDINGAVDWIFILEPRDQAIVTDAHEERWLYIYKNGSLAYGKASPEDPLQEIERIVPEFELEPGFEIW